MIQATAVAVEFVGRYQTTIWEAGDGSVVIARVLDAGSGGLRVVKGPLDAGPKLQLGLSYRFHGRWQRHEKHGMQFDFATYSAVEPHDRRGVIAYLVSIADGIGEKRAARLWEAFGSGAVEVMRMQPERVVAAGIMPEQAAAEASQSLHDEGAWESVKIDLLALFSGRGFQAGKLIKECLSRWGARAPEFIRKNPYLLMMKKLPSAGFKRCDRLYVDLGHPRNRLKRQALCCWHAIRSDSSGHTWFAGKSIASALGDTIAGADPLKALRLAIRSRLLAKRKDDNGVWLAEHRKAHNEAVVADKVRAMTAEDGGAGFLWPSPDRCSSISAHQRQQLAVALSARLGLLTGTPGTGKTYTTGSLVDVLAEQFGMSSIAVCAPTGKAAVRVTAAMHRAGVPIRATTIHALLEIGANGHVDGDWGFKRNAGNPLDQKFVIVDEASMVDTDLAAALFSAIGPETHLLFCGDPFQLPPVGHGAPLRDMVAAGVPNGHLSEIRRNAGAIVRACAAIKDGQPFEASDRFDPDAGLNLRHIEAATPEAQIETLLALLGKIGNGSSSHRWHPLWDVQVLIATNDSGPLSRKPLNRLLQTHLNPTGCSHPDHHFRAGDKVICLRNHFALDANDPNGEPRYVANGEIGEVLDVTQPRKIMAQFGQPERYILIPVGKGKGEEDAEEGGSGTKAYDFDLAYAVTCHKGQGSEWPVVIVAIDSAAGARRVCSREWIYTAISRASQLCITVGRLGVAHQMAKRPTLERRKTLLKELITGEAKR